MPAAPTVNFGRNVRFTPNRVYRPANEAEVVALLDEHAGGQVRVVGSRHAWSDAIVSNDVLVDLSHFNGVSVSTDDGGATWATVGGGTQMKRVLAELQRQAGVTTPSIGLITEQTIAGAISTGTHGSGKHSLSHYIDGLRIACYDAETGRAQVVTVDGGDALRAARCGLGCLGIILEVRFRCVPQYYVTEQATPHATVEEVLALEGDWPLQQFFLIPHSWKFFAQQRQVAAENRRRGLAWLYRIYWFLVIDLGLHIGVKLAASVFRSRVLIRLLYRCLLPLFLISRWRVTDRSDHQLVMEHELFRHLEIELFVTRSKLPEALDYVTQVLQIHDGSRERLDDPFVEQLQAEGLAEQLTAGHGSYVHHYAICVRRVEPDDTLISMSSGGEEDWYAISLITYVEPRDPFFAMARFLALSMSRLFAARAHWGKYFPLDYDQVQHQYDSAALATFRDTCRQFDPHGVFRNDYVNRVLGFTQTGRDRA